MAEDLGVSVLKLDGDLTPLGRKIDEAERKAKTGSKSIGSAFAKDLKRATVPALAALGAIGLGVVKSVNAASDLGEQVNKASVVFEKSAPSILAWGKTTASSLGISNRAALEAAGTFGNMLKPMGLAVPLTAKMSRGLVELAADLASFNNASPEETLEALRSGLAGETEPLRKFGVFLNEARVRQEALSLGLIKTAKQDLPAAAKAQATYSLIMKDTTDAQGDFARTSDSVANAQRIMRAEVEDLGAQLGMALLPAVQSLLGFGLDLVQVIGDNTTEFKILVGVVGGFSAAIILANSSLAIYNASLLAAVNATKALRIAMAATPWLAAITAVGFLAEHFLTQKDTASQAEEAQRDLTDALREYQDAVKAGKSARLDLEAANLRLERAEIAVKQAVNDRRKVDKDSKATLLERREADLRVAEALNARRRAELDVKNASEQGRKEQIRQNNASKALIGSFGRLTAEFQDNTTEQKKFYKAGRDTIGVLRNVTVNAGAARRNANAYADALENMARKARASNPRLARTAELAATLARAWGRVVSLPSAREFVARFTIITRVEDAKGVFTRQHGGPVKAFTPYIVGEKGPELFFSESDGEILSHMQSSRFEDGLMSSMTGLGTTAIGTRTGGDVHFHFDRYRGTTRDLMNDMRQAVQEHRRANGGQDPFS